MSGTLGEFAAEHPGSLTLIGPKNRGTSVEYATLDGSPTPSAEKRSLQMIYDSREHIFPATILNGRGHRTRMAFHPGLGVAGLVEDLNGAVTALYYDGFGRLRSHKAPGGDDLDVNYLVTCGVLPMAAPPLSNCFRETHAAGPEITTAYDVLGRPVVENTLARADGKRVVTETYYDGLGRLARLSRRRFESDTAVYTTYEYDNLGRILAESRPDGTSTRA